MAHVEFRDQFGTFGKILIVQNHQINNFQKTIIKFTKMSKKTDHKWTSHLNPKKELERPASEVTLLQLL